MAIDSVSKLTEYCLRKLGKPVINIEVDATQTKDRVNDAVKFFVDRHFDGVEEVFFKKTILPTDVTNGYLTVDGDIVAVTEYMSKSNTSGMELFDQAEYNFMEEYHKRGGSGTGGNLLDYYMSRSYINTLNLIVGKANNSYSFNKATNRFYTQDGLSSVGSGELLGDTIDFGDWTTTNSVITAKDAVWIDGETTAGTVTSAAGGVFGMTQTVDTKNYVRGTFTARAIIKTGATYTGNIIMELTDRNGVVVNSETIELNPIWRQQFVSATFNIDHINDLIINIRTEDAAAAAGETFNIREFSLYKNNFVVLRGYKAVNMEDDTEIFEDRYLQALAIAYIKQQWGNNTKKYEGVQLPGGVTMRGQEIWQEATEEINKIEHEIVEKFEMPAMPLIG